MVSTDLRMASFRIDGEKWASFLEYARENHTTATSLILNYIDSCLNDSHNGVNTNGKRNDNDKNSDIILKQINTCLDRLAEESNDHYNDRDKILDSIDGLIKEDELLKAKIEKLEETVKNIRTSADSDRLNSEEKISKHDQKLNQLSQSIKNAIAQLNECELNRRTIEQLRQLLADNGIKTRKDTKKPALLELILENGITVV